MITASSAFAQNIAMKSRRTGVRVRLDVLPEAVAASSWTQTAAAPYSTPEQLSNFELDCQSRIATCEPNFFKLDGRTKLESANEIGYVGSTMSDASGQYSSPYPGFTVIMSGVFDCQGFSLYFNRLDNEYAVDFDITFYTGASFVERYEVRGNSASRWVSYDQVDGIDRAVVTIYSWSAAKHRARVSEAVFGIIQVWGTQGDSGLFEVVSQDEVDITNQSLPFGDVSAKIDNRSRDFNVLNPTGLAAFIRAGAELSTYFSVMTGEDYEFIKTGTYFFKSWKDSGPNQVELTAVDTIGYFADIKPLLANRTTIGLVTATAAATDLFNESGVPASRYSLSGLSGLTASEYLLRPYADDFIEELRTLAEYCCKIVICNTSGVIQFADLPVSVSLSVPRQLSKSDADITQIEQVKGVDVSIYGKTVNAATSQILQEIKAISGTVQVTYEVGYDHNSISAAVTGASSWSVVSQGYGRITLSITASGSVTITISGTGEISYPKRTLSIDNPSCTDPNAKRLEIDNPHVTTDARAQTIANWIIANYNSWYAYKLDWIGDPRLEVLDQIQIENRYGTDRAACVTKTVLTFSGGISEAMEARGA